MGTNVAMGITVIGVAAASFWLFGDDVFDSPLGLAISVIGGLIVGWALGKSAEYYTSDHFNPVKKIAQQSETGPATTVLGGISTGMVSRDLLGAARRRRYRRRLLGWRDDPQDPG
ncbi:MAG: sodium/proton-translocating pyrophosphatase [Acidimicrobiales bacterium]